MAPISFLLPLLLLYGCVPLVPTFTEEEKKSIRVGLGASSSAIWEIRTSYDRMTHEAQKRAVSPIILSEDQTEASFITVFCGKLLEIESESCIIGFMFPLRELLNRYNTHRWRKNEAISFRTRFDKRETKRVVFIPINAGQEVLIVNPKGASNFIEDLSTASVLRLELTWQSRGRSYTKYYNYPLDNAWDRIKQLHPDMNSLEPIRKLLCC